MRGRRRSALVAVAIAVVVLGVVVIGAKRAICFHCEVPAGRDPQRLLSALNLPDDATVRLTDGGDAYGSWVITDVTSIRVPRGWAQNVLVSEDIGHPTYLRIDPFDRSRKCLLIVRDRGGRKWSVMIDCTLAA